MSDVSVVMATYNGGRYVEEQLRSILNQTEPPLEIVVSDDGSTDDTLAVVERVALDSAVPIRVHRTPVNLGYGENFLQALGRARGRFIAFADQDDRWLPEKLARSRAALVLHDAVLVAHPMTLIDPDGVVGEVDTQGITATVVHERGTLDPFGVYFGLTLMVRRDLVERIDPALRGVDTWDPSMRLSHDRWAFALAWSLGRTVVIAEPLVLYRQHGAQQFGAPSLTLRERIRAKLAEGVERLDVHAAVADERAALFAAASGTGDAARRWQRVARLVRARAAIHRADCVLPRAQALLRAAAAGAYRPFASGGLGLKRLIEDAGLAFLGGVLRRV